MVWADRYLDHLAVERGLSDEHARRVPARPPPLRRVLREARHHRRRMASTRRRSGRSWPRSPRRRGATRSVRTARVRSHARSRPSGRSIGSCSARARSIAIPHPRSCSRSCRARSRIRSTVDEVARLLEAPDVATPVGLRDRAILEVLYGAGLRISELVGLDVDDVDLEDGFVRVAGEGREGAGGAAGGVRPRRRRRPTSRARGRRSRRRPAARRSS